MTEHRRSPHDPPTNAFEPGNQLWRLRERPFGQKKAFANEDELWEAAVAYFEWVEDNPLREQKLVTFQGAWKHAEVTKMRAMTVAGLCLHMGVSVASWHNWKQEGGDKYRPDLVETMAVIDAIIREQKFTGAAADLLNANIIARELGLADKTEVSGPGGKPLQTITKTMTPQEAAEAYAGTLSSDEG